MTSEQDAADDATTMASVPDLQDKDAHLTTLQPLEQPSAPDGPASRDGDPETLAADTQRKTPSGQQPVCSFRPRNRLGRIVEEPHEQRQFELKARFYALNKQLDQYGNFRRDDALRQGTFRSEVDARHFLRVAYSAPAVQGSQPSPEKGPVDVLPEKARIWTIRLDSEPIGVFLERLLGVRVRSRNVMEVFSPFRVLIQNFAAICDHLSSLEKKYGEETPSATPSTAPEPVYETKVAFDHFRFLVDFMNTHLEPSIRTYNQIQLGECSKITFPDLWMLFDPGSIVYSDHTRVRRRGKRSLDFDPWLTYNRMSRVLSAVGGGPLRRGLAQQIGGTKSLPLDDNVPHRDSVADKYSTLHLTCYIVEWNTTTWHACPVVFDFPPFEGEKDVTSFTVYPIHKSHPLRAQLKERGEKYIKLTTVSHWQYEGMTMGNGEGSEVFHASSQVVVDLKMAVQRGFLDFLDFTAEFDILTRSWLPPKGNEVMEMYRSGYTRTYIDEYGGEVRLPQDVYTDIQEKQFTQGFNTLTKFLDDIEKVKKRGDLNELIEVMQKDDNILLLPSTVSGYALRHRLWAKFDVDLLKPVSYNSGWDDLVLPKGHQELVQALVDAHPREDPQLFDVGSKRVDSNLLSKKGKGCVVLLHGPPGVGKTSTAECAAASTKRPLFHLTCGELGGRVTDVDRGLEDLFDLAHKWGCVLLLEEADVFLQKRGGDSLHRNALVSVFLRVMEHYSGILFVSVNRGVAIDDAFRSRVNLALSYPPLSKTQSKKVWNINIRRLEKQSEDRVKDGKPAITIQQDGILAFAAESYKTMRWNGRQIYNAFQTAFALADSKARRSEASELVVGKDEFRTVANSLTAFDACLAQTEDAANEDKGDDSESSDLEGDVISMRSNSGNDESG